MFGLPTKITNFNVGRKGRDAEYLLRAAMNAKMNNGRWTAPDPARAYNTNMVKAFERRVRAQKKKLEFEGAVHSREVEHRLAREKSMKTKFVKKVSLGIKQRSVNGARRRKRTLKVQR